MSTQVEQVGILAASGTIVAIVLAGAAYAVASSNVQTAPDPVSNQVYCAPPAVTVCYQKGDGLVCQTEAVESLEAFTDIGDLGE